MARQQATAGGPRRPIRARGSERKAAHERGAVTLAGSTLLSRPKRVPFAPNLESRSSPGDGEATNRGTSYSQQGSLRQSGEDLDGKKASSASVRALDSTTEHSSDGGVARSVA